ncbi:MAG: aryl-sulfate sulfotransferase, partial [Candidatus Zixiibacteriota bacterium]
MADFSMFTAEKPGGRVKPTRCEEAIIVSAFEFQYRCECSVRRCLYLLLIICAFAANGTTAEDQTVGLFLYDTAAFDGYTLFSPMPDSTTYLIDMYGRVVHSWTADLEPGNLAYLLENGHLLLAARVSSQGLGAGGRVQEFDWDGNLLWEFDYNSAQYIQHHDIEPLPNGNILILARETRTRLEAIALGRDPSLLFQDVIWPEHIIEVEPTGLNGGNIVWEWHLWDHLIQDYDSTKANYGIVADHPELLDINFTVASGLADWIHANSVDYNPLFNQLVISVRRQSEIWIIDHSTSTAEAASHSGGNSGKGGDILYRWGNPQGYDRGDSSDAMLSGQHDARWIEPGFPGEGNLLI